MGTLKRRGLSLRQRKMVKNVTSGAFKTMRAAADAAGYGHQTDPAIILNRPLVRSELTKALEGLGLNYEDIVRPVKDALKANQTARSPKTGELTRTTIPDHEIRLEAHEKAVALLGGIPKVGEAIPAAHGLNLFIAVNTGEKAAKTIDVRPGPAPSLTVAVSQKPINPQFIPPKPELKES